MTTLPTLFLITLLAMSLGAALLHLTPKLGAGGKALSHQLCRAPLLDLVVTYFTAGPMIVGLAWGQSAVGGPFGWLAGLAAVVAGQVVALLGWCWTCEFLAPSTFKGPRIVVELNKAVGPVRNHAALWVTALAVPLFWFVRLAEYVVYSPLIPLVKFPKYNQGEWVNVSRQKFEGLVGHDRIWCLYCDWMTGVWSLGSEMLRNVESFWCPIQFGDAAKCENCKHDFPDVKNSWVPADASMQDVTDLLRDKLKDGNHSWHGHPTRLTIEGKEQAQSTTD